MSGFRFLSANVLYTLPTMTLNFKKRDFLFELIG